MNSLTQRLSASFARNIIYPVWAKRDHPYFFGYRQEFERSQYYSAERLAKLQLERLRELLTYAKRECSFYRERMESANLDPATMTSIAELSALPLLTKRDIQTHREQMMAAGFQEKDRVRNQTGGSTGSPLQFYVDKERFDSRKASTERHNLWTGMRPGDWCAHLWGARLDQIADGGWWSKTRNALIYRLIELNTSMIKEEDWARFVENVRAKRPRFLLAYANSAVLFAEYVRDHKIEDIKFEAIITTAEVLLPEQRVFLEKTFHGKVFDRYGCREVSIIASECEEHSGLHVNAEAILVELIPDPSVPEGAGKIVVTDLLNRSMPLIRYEIGDVGRWSDKGPCKCGRGLPLLAEVQGRTTDFLTLKDGRKISGPSLTLVVADMPDVQQVQFVQKDVDAIVLRVVPGRGYGESTRAELRKRLDLYLQGLAIMDIEETQNIQSETSGKYRFVVNEMNTALEAEMVQPKT
jgi:phenylacetate-CoA ligase